MAAKRGADLRGAASTTIRTTRRRFMLQAGALAAAEWFGGRRTAWAAPARRGGTLRMAQAADIANFDPFYTVPNSDFMYRSLYDSLIRLDAHGKAMPQLAESWTLASDGKSVDIKLRRGVKFHSGRELDASDVAYSVKFVQNPHHFSQLSKLFLPISEFEVHDKYTLTMHLSRPYAAILDPLNALFVLDKENAGDLKSKPAGSGPFLLENWEPGNQLTLVRNPAYWDASHVYLDRVVMRAIPDPTSLVTTLQAGDVDVVWNFPLSLYSALQRDTRLTVALGVLTANVFDLALNVKRPVFTKKLFRQAINYALDRNQVTKTVLYGVVQGTQLPFPSFSIAYFSDLDHYRYDLATAKALVEKAGMQGASFTAIASDQIIPGSVALGQVLQASLKQIGVNMVVQNLESARYNQYDHTSNFDMMIHAFGGVGWTDPDSQLNGAIVWWPTEKNITGFYSPRYSELVAAAGATTNLARRKALYRQIDEIILDEAWDIVVTPDPQPWAWSRKVQGFSYDIANYPVLVGTSLIR
jgi:peptide/nickel transport system substrate-binding protein